MRNDGTPFSRQSFVTPFAVTVYARRGLVESADCFATFSQQLVDVTKICNLLRVKLARILEVVQ